MSAAPMTLSFEDTSGILEWATDSYALYVMTGGQVVAFTHDGGKCAFVSRPWAEEAMTTDKTFDSMMAKLDWIDPQTYGKA